MSLYSRLPPVKACVFFFFNDTATTEIYTSFPTRRSSDLYFGSQYVHRSQDHGKTWQIISPDLTTDDPRKQQPPPGIGDRKSTRLNSSHSQISYAVFCLKKKTSMSTPFSRSTCVSNPASLP